MKYEVQMLVEGIWYTYGTWRDRNKANEIAIQVREEREVETQVIEKDI